MDIFDQQPYGGKPPSSNPDTSPEAADRIASKAATLRRKVYRCLLGCPSTDDELEVVLGLTHQCVSARRRELVLLGAVEWTGAKRLTRSGRSARIWKAIPEVDITRKLDYGSKPVQPAELRKIVEIAVFQGMKVAAESGPWAYEVYEDDPRIKMVADRVIKGEDVL